MLATCPSQSNACHMKGVVQIMQMLDKAVAIQIGVKRVRSAWSS